MKKRVRLLSLVLSMVLLFISAVPAFAYDMLDRPPDSFYTVAEINENAYYVTAIRNDVGIVYGYGVNEVYYNPFIDSDCVLEGSVAAGDYVWDSEDTFNSTYRADIMGICSSLTYNSEPYVVAETYSCGAHTYSFEINNSLPKTVFAALLTCYHYRVAVIADLGDGGTFTQDIDYMPLVGGDFMYLYY